MSNYGNYGYDQHVGYEATTQGEANFKSMWDPERLKMYQKTITHLLAGVEPSGRPIVVPLETIGSMLYSCYQSNSPSVGDIYSRYIIDGIENVRNDPADIADQMINIIVSTIRNEYENTAANFKLTKWDSVLGDFNKAGLRAHPPIKLRKNRVPSMQFHMNY